MDDYGLKVLVTGGRHWDYQEEIERTLDRIHQDIGVILLIHGNAKGVDSLASDWAEKNNINTDVYPALWSKYGKKAGPIRNQQMLDEGRPDIVMAFPGSKGTNDMVRRAIRANIEVIRWEDMVEDGLLY